MSAGIGFSPVALRGWRAGKVTTCGMSGLRVGAKIHPGQKGFGLCWPSGLLVSLLVLAGTFPSRPAQAVSARYAYELAYDNVASGDWYRDSNNETATLAWGEAYVMMSLAAMFRATGDAVFLQRLAWHADGVLAQRDDARGVTDYRGVSGACWRDLHYQPNDEPYCYVVHSGQICQPLVDFARLVATSGLDGIVAYDGTTLGAKASTYVTACEQTVAFHEDQWHTEGYYVFRPDADFLSYPGRDLPLNQSNALGRVLFALYDVTGNATYLAKARAMAQRFHDQVSFGGDGAALWNYWGGAYQAPGEDISHAALNVNFALDAAAHGAAFTDQDLGAMAATFMKRIYRDDETFSDRIGGGSAVNGSSYRLQIGRWVSLTPYRSSLYAAVRQVFEQDLPPDSVGSGSYLLGWAFLAAFEPVSCRHFFYSVDWEDLGTYRRATAYGANILTVPPDLSAPCLMAIPAHVQRPAVLSQWDGDAYHPLLTWTATTGFETKYLAYEPSWPYVYWQDGVLFEFEDDFAASQAIEIGEVPPGRLPTIGSVPPCHVRFGDVLTYDATATGDEPFWWHREQAPSGAQVDFATGRLTWTADQSGSVTFTVTVDNDFGSASQTFVVVVEGGLEPDAGLGSDGGGDPDPWDAGLDAGPELDAGARRDAARDAVGREDGATLDAGGMVSAQGGCDCRVSSDDGSCWPVSLLILVGLVGWLRRRTRRDQWESRHGRRCRGHWGRDGK